jgi:hypothetical protein
MESAACGKCGHRKGQENMRAGQQSKKDRQADASQSWYGHSFYTSIKEELLDA